MKKIFIVLLEMAIIFTFIGMNFTKCFASEGTISAPSSVNIGAAFTVTVVIPAEAVGYQGEIEVRFADGTTLSSGPLVNVTGITGDFTHPGNMTANFTAPATEGNATISVINLKITDRNSNTLNTNKTLTSAISVVKPVETTPAPAATPTPEPTTPTNTNNNTTPTSNEPSWNNTGDTVYALEKLNVRSGWGTSYSSVGKLNKGDSVTRIAVGSNGWDKINYNGGTAYVMSKYLTTINPNSASNTTNTTTDNSTVTDTNTTDNNSTQEPTWTETGDKVYATRGINVRKGWGTNFEVIGGLLKGQSVTRIAVGSNGWDKIKYNGDTAYVLSKLLTTEEVEPDEENKIDENTVSNNVVDNNIVNATTNTVIDDKDEYNKIVEEIGVLPAVGKNFADNIYFISILIISLIIGFVGLKIRENEEK